MRQRSVEGEDAGAGGNPYTLRPIYLSIYLSVYLSIYLSICLSIYLSIRDPFNRLIRASE